MATPAQDEALDLKRRARRRLVGAIALVLFLVIVPPLVMDLEPKSINTTLQVEIPPQNSAPLPLPDLPVKPVPEEPASPAVVPSEPGPSPATTTKESDAKRVDAETKRVDAETKRAEAILNQEGTYIVALATLSKKENVRQLQSKLTQIGIKSYTEPVKTATGDQTRVRAGPFSSKEAAEKARSKLQQMGYKPGAVSAK